MPQREFDIYAVCEFERVNDKIVHGIKYAHDSTGAPIPFKFHYSCAHCGHKHRGFVHAETFVQMYSRRKCPSCGIPSEDAYVENSSYSKTIPDTWDAYHAVTDELFDHLRSFKAGRVGKADIFRMYSLVRKLEDIREAVHAKQAFDAALNGLESAQESDSLLEKPSTDDDGFEDLE